MINHKFQPGVLTFFSILFTFILTPGNQTVVTDEKCHKDITDKLNNKFAMTIYKSQGLSSTMAGIDLRDECFSHEQFCVACPRVSSASNLIISAPKGHNVGEFLYITIIITY